MHHLAATIGGPAGRAEWQQQLVSHCLDNLEDDMEAHYLLLHKWNAKLTGAIDRHHRTLIVIIISVCPSCMSRTYSLTWKCGFVEHNVWKALFKGS